MSTVPRKVADALDGATLDDLGVERLPPELDCSTVSTKKSSV
jgi:hypothetical protein